MEVTPNAMRGGGGVIVPSNKGVIVTSPKWGRGVPSKKRGMVGGWLVNELRTTGWKW